MACVCINQLLFLYAIYVAAATDIKITEGSTGVEIICNFRTAPVWKINDSLYDSLSLPPLIVPYEDYGLKIERVEKNLNQTNFQCFELNGGGLNVKADSITHLIVTRNANYHPPKVKPVPEITFDYLRFMFNATHKTIAWKFENNRTCKPPVLFKIQSIDCGQTIGNTSSLEYSLPVNEVLNKNDEPFYLIIIAYNAIRDECVRTTPFQLHNLTSEEHSVALGGHSCLNVPTISVSSPHSLFAVWVDNSRDSCTCPLCYSSDGECVLEKCHCYNSSSFAPTLTSGHTNNAQLCWSNTDDNRNNSKIHFFTEKIFASESCESSNHTKLISRRFLTSATFLVKGPPLPPNITEVNNDEETIEICLSAFSHYHITSYDISITDTMGDTIFNQSETKNCITVLTPEESYFAECTPYTISARAYNKIGGSNISWIKFNAEKGKENHCSCLEKKFDFHFSQVIVTSNLAKLQLTCQKKSLTNATIELVLVHVQEEKQDLQTHQQLITCDGNPVNLQYNHLSDNATYTITSIWNINNATIYCNISQFTTGPQDWKGTYLIKIIIVLSTMLCISIIIIIIIFSLLGLVRCHKKCITRSSYQPIENNGSN